MNSNAFLWNSTKALKKNLEGLDMLKTNTFVTSFREEEYRWAHKREEEHRRVNLHKRTTNQPCISSKTYLCLDYSLHNALHPQSTCFHTVPFAPENLWVPQKTDPKGEPESATEDKSKRRIIGLGNSSNTRRSAWFGIYWHRQDIQNPNLARDHDPHKRARKVGIVVRSSFHWEGKKEKEGIRAFMLSPSSSGVLPMLPSRGRPTRNSILLVCSGIKRGRFDHAVHDN